MPCMGIGRKIGFGSFTKSGETPKLLLLITKIQEPINQELIYDALTMFIFNVTEPLLSPIRSLIPTNRSGLDFSALILFIILNFLKTQLLLIG